MAFLPFSLPLPSSLLKLKILRQERLSTRTRFSQYPKQRAHVNQRHFRGKRRQTSPFYYEFQRFRSGGKKLSNVRSFTILRSGDGLVSSNKDNRVNFYGEKSKMRLSNESIFQNTRNSYITHRFICSLSVQQSNLPRWNNLVFSLTTIKNSHGQMQFLQMNLPW